MESTHEKGRSLEILTEVSVMILDSNVSEDSVCLRVCIYAPLFQLDRRITSDSFLVDRVSGCFPLMRFWDREGGGRVAATEGKEKAQREEPRGSEASDACSVRTPTGPALAESIRHRAPPGSRLMDKDQVV